MNPASFPVDYPLLLSRIVLRFLCSLFAEHHRAKSPAASAGCSLSLCTEQGALPSAMAHGRDFPKLEHHFNKAEGGLGGREGGQSISLSPLEAVAQTLAQVTKERDWDELLPPQPSQQMCCTTLSPASHIPASLSVLGLHFPGNLARLTVPWLEMAREKASSTQNCEGEGRLGNISPFIFLGFADVSSPAQLDQLKIY